MKKLSLCIFLLFLASCSEEKLKKSVYEIKIGDRKYLEEKFSFDEQGIILKNEHICGYGHTGDLFEFCGSPSSSVAMPSILQSEIPYTSLTGP